MASDGSFGAIGPMVGAAVRQILRQEPVGLVQRSMRSSSPARTFWTARCGDTEVFVKCAPAGKLAGTKLDAYLSERYAAAGLVPRFFGSHETGPIEVGVWEHVEGGSPEFNDYSDAHLKALVDTLAEISVNSPDAPVASKVRWAAPPLRRIRTVLVDKKPDDLRRLMVLSKSVSARLEPLVTLMNQGATALVHNDLRGANVLQRPSGSLCLIDWESATRGPVGSNLRVFWNSPRRDEAVKLFAQALGRHGMVVSQETLSLTLAIQQGFWALDTGIRQTDVDRLRRGLTTLATLPFHE